MWPFKRWRERAEVRAAFMKYLAPDLVARLASSSGPLRPQVERADLCFILLQVRDDPADQVPAHLARAFDIVLRQNGTICDIMCSMVTVVFGHPIPEAPERSNDHRAESVARLMSELGANIRLVHGTTEGLIGNVGSPHRFHWGPLLSGFARYITALTALEFGQSAEIRPT
ncbi:MAG TPA: hypothetical protein VJV39_01385 [Dongiaceae bacterium]|nr:hypothetical protein [Dongiaceae bacterium]